uniref:NTR domain-containing protein n=1 Tax=Anopheles minimus TaxID=112268 RepID=A0A182VXP5_9DIPT
MKANRSLLSVAIVLALLAILLPTTESCSCLPQHPQTAFCESEYVIVAQVLRRTASKDHPSMDAYKIAIKKEYKMSEEARKLLRHGKLFTSSSGSMCGITLEPNKLYAIAANSEHVGLCDYVRPYSDLSIVEKRGLAGIYRKGCSCRINHCWNHKCNQQLGSCNWTPFAPRGNCEMSYGSCVPAGVVKEDGTPIKCHWRRSPRFGQCMAKIRGS